jgi:hypothetical protein
MRYKNRGRALELHQNNDRRRNRNRRRGMHHNAEWAMVGIRFHRMNVRNLDHGQKRQQDQTHHGSNRQST